jgi:hypothetical protein
MAGEAIPGIDAPSTALVAGGIRLIAGRRIDDPLGAVN